MLSLIFGTLLDEENKTVTNPVIEMKDINESGYSSGKAASPEQSSNGSQICNDVNSNEILAEALNEINSISHQGNNDGKTIKLFKIIFLIL